MDTKGATSSGVKRQKVESWENSVGGLGGRSELGSLVVRKKPEATVTAGAQTDINLANATTSSSQTPTVQNGSSLSLLGAYSDSDDSNSD
ncbi:splicing factor YJU2 [Tachysurus ichikawai]